LRAGLDGVAVGGCEALDVADRHPAMFAGGHEDVLGELREHKQILLAFELPIQNLHLLFQGAQEEEVSGWRQLHFRTDDNYTSARERGV
jgi:hypothetical protein